MQSNRPPPLPPSISIHLVQLCNKTPTQHPIISYQKSSSRPCLLTPKVKKRRFPPDKENVKKSLNLKYLGQSERFVNISSRISLVKRGAPLQHHYNIINTQGKQRPCFQTSKDWNSLPLDIRSSTTIANFKSTFFNNNWAL